MVFCFVQNFFFGQNESSNIYFFCRAKREIFFQITTLYYMTKTLNQIICFPPPKSEKRKKQFPSPTTNRIHISKTNKEIYFY
jgi:hypothetical protein